METWGEMINEKLKDNGDTWEDVEENTMTNEEMDIEFDPGFGRTNGIGFTIWTKNNVYFPCWYDGAEWVDSVSRNPNGKATSHLGEWK